ncbi:hypothetical protein H7849_12595 [Alloacidobacterium dinghuense]|uniref:Lipoprotein n=1 Tax=Alloacidobacterium dinghuense TaxID=2763107 RepID=A0A7G8BQ34_9BACT|nr:hypothetical protein [Alloacidobacterium dinghuense]QNI34654.1 hypothetical protein H7849_12595 [Alloacidobacterium dinghuense]
MTFARTILLTSAALLLVTGCETGRSNKAHASWQYLSDETTTGKPDLTASAPASGQPPVPGSPTAAGPDGLQPLNDNEARQSVGAEEGRPTPPREQKKDPFQRQ